MHFCGLIAIHTLQSAEKCIFFDFSYRNIWSCQKKAVTLHAFSARARVHIHANT